MPEYSHANESIVQSSNQGREWSVIIKPKQKWYSLNIRELFHYSDLIMLFVRRDFVVNYKQTILGPLWFLIQPLITVILFTLIFGNIAKIPTEGVPPVLFYMSGTIIWSYFADCLNSISTTFIKSSNIFGKVYFPRLVVPLSIVISSLLKFFIQFVLFVGFLAYFNLTGTSALPDWRALVFLPFLLIAAAFLALGCGILISAMTTKYRDLIMLISFGVQLWMYACPVVYPASMVPEKWASIYYLNPMASIVQSFRSMFLNTGLPRPAHLLSGSIIIIILFLFGLLIFNRVEKTFMDTI